MASEASAAHTLHRFDFQIINSTFTFSCRMRKQCSLGLRCIQYKYALGSFKHLLINLKKKLFKQKHTKLNYAQKRHYCPSVTAVWAFISPSYRFLRLSECELEHEVEN